MYLNSGRMADRSNNKGRIEDQDTLSRGCKIRERSSLRTRGGDGGSDLVLIN